MNPQRDEGAIHASPAMDPASWQARLCWAHNCFTVSSFSLHLLDAYMTIFTFREIRCGEAASPLERGARSLHFHCRLLPSSSPGTAVGLFHIHRLACLHSCFFWNSLFSLKHTKMWQPAVTPLAHSLLCLTPFMFYLV